MLHRVWVAFGSNQENPLAQLREARERLAKQLTEVVASSVYCTPPWGYTDQPDFYNAVVGYETALSPQAVLSILQESEQAQHRVRTIKNGPRTLDLDILLFDDVSMNTETLIIPHPRMQERAFVLIPLAEIAPTLAVGMFGTAISLAAQADQTGMTRLTNAW